MLIGQESGYRRSSNGYVQRAEIRSGIIHGETHLVISGDVIMRLPGEDIPMQWNHPAGPWAEVLLVTTIYWVAFGSGAMAACSEVDFLVPMRRT